MSDRIFEVLPGVCFAFAELRFDDGDHFVGVTFCVEPRTEEIGEAKKSWPGHDPFQGRGCPRGDSPHEAAILSRSAAVIFKVTFTDISISAPGDLRCVFGPEYGVKAIVTNAAINTKNETIVTILRCPQAQPVRELPGQIGRKKPARGGLRG